MACIAKKKKKKTVVPSTKLSNHKMDLNVLFCQGKSVHLKHANCVHQPPSLFFKSNPAFVKVKFVKELKEKAAKRRTAPVVRTP